MLTLSVEASLRLHCLYSCQFRRKDTDLEVFFACDMVTLKEVVRVFHCLRCGVFLDGVISENCSQMGQ